MYRATLSEVSTVHKNLQIVFNTINPAQYGFSLTCECLTSLSFLSLISYRCKL